MAALSGRLLTAILAVGLLGAGVVAVLRGPVASAALRVPLFPRGLGEARAVSFSSLAGGGSEGDPRSAQRATVFTGAVEEIRQVPRLAVVLAPATGRARVLGAQLRLAGTACAWELREPSSLDEEAPIALDRTSDCAGEERSGPGEATLVVRSEGAIALGILEPRDDAPDEARFVRVRGNGRDLFVRVFAVQPSAPTSVRRVELLAYQWRGRSPAGIWLFLGASGILAVTGALLFPWSPASGHRLVAGAGAGAGLFAAALAVAYAVLVPPMAALDEPYHLRSFAVLASRPEMESEVLRWAELVHVARVRFRPEKTFRPEDRDNPYRQPDPFSFAPEVRSRSAASAAFWRALAPVLAHSSAPEVLLVLRFANAVVFAVCVGLAAAFLAAVVPARWPQLLAVPFLLIPSLPFFATALAELALLASAATLVAASLVALVHDGRRSSWAGLPLGVGAALLFAGGRSPWPLAALLAAMLAARVALGPRETLRPVKEAAVFWTGLALGIAIFFALADPAYVGGVSSDRILAIAPRGAGALAVAFVRSPWPALLLVVLAVALEVGLADRRRRLADGLARPWRRAWRAAAGTGVALVLVSLVASLFLRYPSLPLVPIPNPYPAAEYVGRAFDTLVTALRLRDTDFLTFSSFWGGFGWLDTIPPEPLLVALVLALAAGMIALLLHLRAADDPRAPAFLLAFAVGAALSVVLYGVAIHRLPMNLTGRYMASWHVAVAALAGSGAAVAGRGPLSGTTPRVPRTFFLLLAAGVLHAYCITFIIRRYF